MKLLAPPLARLPLVAAAILCAAHLPWTSRAATIAPAAPAPVFLEAAWAGPVDLPPTIARHRPVQVNFSALEAAQAAGALLQFNCFTDESFLGVVETVEWQSASSFTLAGRLLDQPFSSFVLVVHSGVAVMNLRPGLEGLLQLRYLGNGVHDVRKIDERQFPPCATASAQAVHVSSPRPAPRPAPGDPQADAGNLIDVMVVYTPAARAAAGGTAAMEALITLAFTESNSAYQQSLVTPRIRLVHKAEVSYVETTFSTDLNRLTDPNDGYLDEVHTWRDTYGADLVSLWLNNSSSCGLAWQMVSLSSAFEANAFSTIHWDCATGNYSFSHEMGHNMGCTHDRENSDGQGLDPYSYGWRFYGTNGVQYRTIMAYQPGTRIPRFSNPNVLYYGTPTGIPAGAANAAYNALTINNSASTVANFRQTVVSTNVPPTITAQPLSQMVSAGASVSFSVTAEGTPPLSYQWRKNGSALSGATLSTYNLNNVQTNDAGIYSVRVSNPYGDATSSNATLVVNVPVPLAQALDNSDLTWTTGGAAPWVGQITNSYDGFDAAQSGAISHSQESWLETTVTGPGTLSFWWKVSSESGYDWLELYLDGVLQSGRISGETAWASKSLVVSSGLHTVRWRYVKDYVSSSGLDRGWVDQVAFTPGALTMSGALENPGLLWYSYGNVNWYAQTSVTHDGVDAAASGLITHLQESVLWTTVVGPGTLSFWWKVDCEADYDWLDVYVNGGYPAASITGWTDWSKVTLPLPAGTNYIEWVYSKDDSYSAGADQGWVDQVQYVAGSRILSNAFVSNPAPAHVLELRGFAGASYTVQVSTNLADWQDWTNVIPSATTVWISDVAAGNFSRRFYRVKSP